MIATERTGTLKIRGEQPVPGTARITDSRSSGIRKRETYAASAVEITGAAGKGTDEGASSKSASTGAPRAVLVNITDQQWLVHRTYGTYIVPARPANDEFAAQQIDPRTGRIDLGDKREFEFPISAREIADDIAREINSDAGESSDFGVFVCAGDWPTEEELAAARARMELFYKRLVVQADQEWERSHNPIMISDVQRRAARWLKLEREWFYEPTRQAECPACGERIRPGVAVCRTCGAVLDRAKAAQFGLGKLETSDAAEGSSAVIPNPAPEG